MIGLDEVGRGSWAGPLLVAAVQINTEIVGLDDSKKLTSKKRKELAIKIKQQAQDISLAWIPAHEIDRVGLSEAMKNAMHKAFQGISKPDSDIFIDGNINYLEKYGAKNLVRGESKNHAIAAASVVAKVARDNFMERLEIKFNNFSFAEHKGYGTAMHSQELNSYGPTEIHRKSYEPVKQFIRSRQNS